jgi:hypothetical protein
LSFVIEVARITYGCEWDERGLVKAWPMRLCFGAVGPEVTVDQMLEGRGHAVMLIDHLAELVDSMTPKETPIQLGEGRPAGLARKLADRGFYVELLQVP